MQPVEDRVKQVERQFLCSVCACHTSQTFVQAITEIEGDTREEYVHEYGSYTSHPAFAIRTTVIADTSSPSTAQSQP